MVILLVLCIFVLLVIAASYVCCRFCFFVPKQTEADLFRLSADTEQYAPHREAMTQMVRTVLALPYEDVWIRSDDGLRLHGKYYAGRPGAPVQIMMHGYKSGAERDFCGGAQIAVQGGYHVLLVVPGAVSYMVDREAYLTALESFLRSVLTDPAYKRNQPHCDTTVRLTVCQSMDASCRSISPCSCSKSRMRFLIICSSSRFFVRPSYSAM